jgi:hypothetical protein
MRKMLAKISGGFCLLIALASCSTPKDFAQVRAFANISASMEQAFPDIATDIYASCLRTARYALEVDVRKQAEKKCNEKSEIGEGLLTVNGLLIGYMQSLGQIATDSTVTYTDSLDRLKSGFVKAGLDQAQVNSGISIFEVLLRAATEQYRRDELKRLITTYDDAFQALTGGLKAPLLRYSDSRELSSSLNLEKKSLDAYYESFIKETTPKDYTGPLRVFSLPTDIQWKTEQVKLQSRREQATVYVAILDKISGAHTSLRKLFADRTLVSNENCKKSCNASDLEVISKAQAILSQTVDEIEPLSARLHPQH